MGCDIHSFAEVKHGDRWEKVGDVFALDKFGQKWHGKPRTDSPFDWRSYGMFGFLADVRNYSHVPTIAAPKYSLPPNVSEVVKEAYGEDCDWHTATWLTLRQLMEFDYDQIFWDRRVTKKTSHNVWDGAALAEEGEGVKLPMREFLGERFFAEIETLKTLGNPDDVRIVFWFDN